MKLLKLGGALVLLGALVLVLQLVDSPTDSPSAGFQRLADPNFRGLAQGAIASGQPGRALMFLTFVLENDAGDQTGAATLRQDIHSNMMAEKSPVARVEAIGWAAQTSGGNSFANLGGVTVADSVVYGEIAELAGQGAFENNRDELIAGLDGIRDIGDVFPPAGTAFTLIKAAKLTGAVSESLSRQLRHIVTLIQPNPKSAASVEKFKENLMPVFELSRHCRTWTEFQTILQQADSPDQVKVLIRMVAANDTSPKRLALVLAIASTEGQSMPSKCLDYIMRRGQSGLDVLYAAAAKGAPGLKFAAEHPALTTQSLRVARRASDSLLEQSQSMYQSLRYRYGAVVSALKYMLIAALFGLLVLEVVPGSYLERVIASVPTNGRSAVEPGPIHHLLVALAVGVVLSGVAYILSMAMRVASVEQPAAVAAAELGAVTGDTRGDNGMLSATVVLLSLAVHVVVWFFVRSKIRAVEDDDRAGTALQLKRLENLDIFLDLPLFTGLALTVIAFILITLDAGMSRHFAYTSTVVGIVSAVSLRVRYLYPLKERLIRSQ